MTQCSVLPSPSVSGLVPDITIDTPEALKEFFDARFKSAAKRKSYKPSRSIHVCLTLLASIEVGRLDIVLPDQSCLRFENKDPNAIHIPEAVLYVHNQRAARRFLTGGHLGFCEAYLDGDWSSPDMTALFELVSKNSEYMKRVFVGKKWVRVLSRLAHILNRNSKSGSRKNIYSHYDIGNNFYAAWLDETMTYSSAYYGRGAETLKQAQEDKYQEIIDSLDLRPEHHVLEVGCGWGGFAEYAARHVGCKITGITVSQAQYDYACQRIENESLDDKVEIRFQDYRDTEGQFDRIVSIEMFEAVGEEYWSTYFQTLKRRLKSGGKAVLQIITIRDEDFHMYRKSADYIQRYIFPGGMLPSKTALKQEAVKSGLNVVNMNAFGQDYAKTLKLWNARFQDTWSQIKSPKLDARFKRLWEQYLCYCEAGFNAGSIDVVHVTLDHDDPYHTHKA